MNEDSFSEEVKESLKNNNNKLNIDELLSLISDSNNSVLLNEHNNQYSSGLPVQHIFYNGKIIGESQWYGDKIESSFRIPRIENYIYFMINDYLIYIRIEYFNVHDNSICESYPEYFEKVGDEYQWVSAEKRTEFFEFLMDDSKEKIKSLDDIVRVYKTILETLSIKQYN